MAQILFGVSNQLGSKSLVESLTDALANKAPNEPFADYN